MLSAHCSLLAPDKEDIVGERPVDAACEPAPACGPPPTTMTPDLTPDRATELPGIVAKAQPGQTIFLAPGEYPLSAVLSFNQPDVTLASATGNADDVELSGSGLPVVIEIRASGVTLSAITITGALEAAIRLGAGADTEISGTRLCGVRIVDGGSQFVLAPSEFGWSDCGRVEGSTLELTDSARDAACTAAFVSGISVEGGRGWVVRTSEIRGFRCPLNEPGSAPCSNAGKAAAVLFTTGSRDTIVENNRIFDSARGLVLGYTATTKPPRSYDDRPYPNESVDHYDGIARNNVIFSAIDGCLDTGIELNHAKQPQVLHNTIVQTSEAPVYAAIDRRYTSTLAVIKNNLTRGLIRSRDEAPEGVLEGNVMIADLSYFVAPLADPADFHLLPTASMAIGQGVPADNAGVDIDGQPHDPVTPDAGADEVP